MAVRLIRPINSAIRRHLATAPPASSAALSGLITGKKSNLLNSRFAPNQSKSPVHQCQRLYSALSPVQRHPPSLYGQLQPISFSIIAHIDHGKSTLADRLLEMTGTIPIGADGQVINKQVLDSLKVERERGITVKSQAVSMIYDDVTTKQKWLLNLIDTPGHVDFAYEVSRSLSACQIALLVVDATQGIQSQTLSVFRVAMARGLRIIPVINKIDLPGASPDAVLDQLHERLGLNVLPGESEEAIMVSAKTGKGVEDVLKRLVAVGSESTQDVGDGQDEKMRSLVFDSWYDSYKGVVALISVKDGAIRKGDKIASAHSRKRYEVLDIGVNSPTAIATGILRKGQVGWVICNMKSVPEASIGDTLHHDKVKVDPLPGFKPSVPMIYCSAFPVSSADFPKLEMAIQKLALNDRSVTWSRESSLALGQGVKLGLLGALHMEIFRARLADEYGMEVLITNPTVAYRIVRPNEDENEAKVITNPLEFPDDEVMRSKRSTKNGLQIQEPMVIGTLTCPEEYLGAMSQLCFDRRGEEIDLIFQDGFGTGEDGKPVGAENAGGERLVIMKHRLPLSEIVTDFFGELKSKTAGFATFDYEDDGWQASDLVRLSFLLTGTPLDALSQIVHRSKAVDVAKVWTQKLKDIVPRQQYEVNIQAMVGGRVVSSEKKTAYRKDVTAGLYGGHYERKLKHLNKQKEGKKRLRAMSVGRVQIPQENFMKLFEAK
ncbi:GTP-binding protein lepa [Meira miltonrushii]|uniref:GTP-binding protein lepa n=1 Tax=Meira miltonrushii TaxID=1280837 RepID=A0A316V402_9BASI|nr:GTP-binding protein lepa [Meira miltonrushii]PWN32250.1 GTP-binding protein lepa [Meira miltonrushii]